MIVNKYSGNGGGGGGSTYVLPPATASRLGGIKVGSGLTIDNEGVLSTSGGTAPAGGGDYMVVSGLPATAQEGQLFFVPSHTENVLYRIYAFDCSGMYQNEEEGYVLGDLNGKAVYYQWNNTEYGWFHWDWGENEHEWKYIPGWGYYMVGENNYTFYAKLPADIEVDLSGVNQNVAVDSSSTETVQIEVAPASYRYSDGLFWKQVIKIKLNDFVGSDYGFGSNWLYDYLQWFTEDELKQNFVFEYNGNFAVYGGYEPNQYFWFTVSSPGVSTPIGTPVAYLGYNVIVSYDGSVNRDNENHYNVPITLTVNLIDSGLTSDVDAFWTRVASNGAWGGNPISVKIVGEDMMLYSLTQNCWFRTAYDAGNDSWVPGIADTDPNVRIFGCEFYLNGDKITAEWVVDDGTVVGGAPINWIVASNVHSAADSTIPSNE